MLPAGELGSFSDLAAVWVTGVLDAALRGTLLLLAAGLAARLLRDAPAAARHAVWGAALVGLLLTPLLQPVVPAVEAPFVPDVRVPGASSASATTAAAPAVVPGGAAGSEPSADAPPALPVGPAPASAEEGPVAVALERVRALGTAGVLGLLWLAGFLAVLGTLVLGKLRVWWLARGAERVRDGPWTELRDELAGVMDLGQEVRILRSSRPLVPMTWGLLRPRVLLPAAADAWPEACKRNVLLHELAHVKRRDLLVQHLSRLACALYWFHPLVWMAARRLRLEQEEAADDHVLRGGALASDYARHLVGLARVLKAIRSTARAGSTGGGRTDFGRRMRALLSPGRERRALSRRWIGLTAAAAGALIVALAALAPATGADDDEAAAAEALAAAAPRAGNAGVAEGMELPSIRVERRDEGAAADRSGPTGSEPGPAEDSTATAAGGGSSESAREGPPGPGTGARRPAAGAGERARPAIEEERAAATEERPPARAEAASGGTGEPARTGDGRTGPGDGSSWSGAAALDALSASTVALWRPTAAGEATEGAGGEPASASGVRTTTAELSEDARDLVARLDASTDSLGRVDLLHRIARSGETRTMTMLMEVSFRAARRGDRLEAVRTLASEANREVGGRFLYQVARANPWPAVRAEAIHQLRQLRPEQVVPWLVHLAYHDEERVVQRRAVGALARLGPGEADSSLMQIARSHPDAEVRIAAIYWLVRTGSEGTLAKYVQTA